MHYKNEVRGRRWLAFHSGVPRYGDVMNVILSKLLGTFSGFPAIAQAFLQPCGICYNSMQNVTKAFSYRFKFISS